MSRERITRRTTNSNDQALENEIEKSLKVSSYEDAIIDAFQRGSSKVDINVPNFSSNSTGMSLSDFYPEWGEIFGKENKTETGNEVRKFSNTETKDNKNKTVISKTQYLAIQKYPTLVEYLGKPEGEKIARIISEQLTSVFAEAIGENSKEIKDEAIHCTADKRNIKQYFKGPDWLCRVTVSGNFQGNEAIYYDKQKDLAFVLRKHAESDEISYTDVTKDFNVITEIGEETLENE